MNYGRELEIMAEILFIVYLVWAAWQDYKEMQVIRYSHSLGVFAVLCMAIAKWNQVSALSTEYLSALIMIVLIQYMAYRFRIYGMADVIVFCMCGWFLLLQKGVGFYFVAYVMLMAVSCCMLFVVQILKNNIQGLRLKHSVAYIPYICVSFILTNLVV